MSEYRTLAGTFMYLGTSVLPQASFATSLMQQRINCMNISHLLDANSMLRDVMGLDPVLPFPALTVEKGTAMIVSLSDASMGENSLSTVKRGMSQEFSYRKSMDRGKYSTVLVGRVVRKREFRIRHFGEEIIAAAYIDEIGIDLRQTYRVIFPHCHIRHEMIGDFKALFDTITTLHEGREYRRRRTVSRIRNSFESRELDAVRWLPGCWNVSYALTKSNPVLWINSTVF